MCLNKEHLRNKNFIPFESFVKIWLCVFMFQSYSFFTHIQVIYILKIILRSSIQFLFPWEWRDVNDFSGAVSLSLSLSRIYIYICAREWRDVNDWIKIVYTPPLRHQLMLTGNILIQSIPNFLSTTYTGKLI